MGLLFPEEAEIGKKIFPIYENIKLIAPNLQKEKIINFVKKLDTTLNSKKLIFYGWQLQRDVKRKIRSEVRVILLSELKNYKEKIDDLTEGIFRALEGAT